ncbi:hypothetical protein YQE_01984, partial [Dendroctonus ponderosae]
MDRLRRSFRDSFRRRKDRVPESSKPHQWSADETAVRSATCTFAVKYLGCVEVFDSRGMQVCEEALKVLRVGSGSRRRPIRAVLHVSGDGLRVVEEETKGLIVDQTIEKVSFCAPDRNHERGFSYICRDGTTRSGSDDFNFNNTTSLNQNTVNLNLTSINNTFNQSITATPTANVASIAPVTLSFSPNFNRAISLDSGAETFKAKPADPFDAEWAETAARQGSSSTNPFLNHTPTPPSSFQIQL